jgi:hypothetical protein
MPALRLVRSFDLGHAGVKPLHESAPLALRHILKTKSPPDTSFASSAVRYFLSSDPALLPTQMMEISAV